MPSQSARADMKRVNVPGRLVLSVLALAAVLAAVCLVARLAGRGAMTAQVSLGDRRVAPEDLRLAIEADGDRVLRAAEAVDIRDGYLRVRVQPGQPGRAVLRVTDPDGQQVAFKEFQVTGARTVLDRETMNFAGDTVLMGALTVFFLGTALLMIRSFRSLKGTSFYTYQAIYTMGFAIFCGLVGLMQLALFVGHLTDPFMNNVLQAIRIAGRAGYVFMVVSFPFVVVFAVAMVVSNIALLRHGRFSVRKLLGMLIGLLMVIGEQVGWRLFRDYSGPESLVIAHDVAGSLYGTVYAYIECILFASIVCGLLAARHRPAHDRDCIVILGCWFRPDGTLPPLLKGRADAAIAFWREEKEKTGREALMIPSGGRGPDEPMPEAEAIAAYLRGQGIPEALILPETRSANTYENMAFSKALIGKRQAGDRVAYATTNYHVFRSGLWANLAGMPAEGIGGKTKWWYWPNAFMRECVGLLRNRIRQELAVLAILAALFTGIAMLIN